MAALIRTVCTRLEGFSLAEVAGQLTGQSWLANWLNDPETFLESSHSRWHSDRSLYEVLYRGFLPRATLLDRDLIPDFWAGYQRTYIERDARLLAEVKDWQQFGLFLRLCAALTAQEINYSHLGRDLGLTPQTAKRWLRVLLGTFQWYEVPPFGTNLIKRVSGKPKGYLADTGFVCYCQQITSPAGIGGHPLYGALFETAVAGEIRKQLALLPGATAMYHWRSAGGAEVDLILERDGVLYPIEIKGTSNPARRDASGIHAFRKSYPRLRIAPGLIIAPMEHERRLSEETVAIPWDLSR
jgi:predicted AAA+ superfamily ATPase